MDQSKARGKGRGKGGGQGRGRPRPWECESPQGASPNVAPMVGGDFSGEWPSLEDTQHSPQQKRFRNNQGFGHYSGQMLNYPGRGYDPYRDRNLSGPPGRTNYLPTPGISQADDVEEYDPTQPGLMEHGSGGNSGGKKRDRRARFSPLPMQHQFVTPPPSRPQPHTHAYTRTPGSSGGRGSSGGNAKPINMKTLDSAAANYVLKLAENKTAVTVDKVVDMLKQHFQVNRFGDLNIRRPTEIPTLDDLQKSQSKVNAYIHAFVMTRSIATLHELKHHLAELFPPKKSFSELNLGPLTKQSLVYELFKFPQNIPDEDIPDISTIDVLKDLKKYLTVHGWRQKVKLEDFMEFLLKEHNVKSPYELGVRISSVALGISVIKTAQRHEKEVTERVRNRLKAEMEQEIEQQLFKIKRKVFQASDPESDGHERKLRYASLAAADAVLEVYECCYEMFNPSMRRTIDDFFHQVLKDPLATKIFQVALCCGKLDLPDDARGRDSSSSSEEEDDDEDEQGSSNRKPSPPESAILEELQKYLDKCGGTLTLATLARIEAKLAEKFQFQDFLSMGHGSFVTFLSHHPQVLEDFGGSLLGAGASTGGGGSAYHPSRQDVLEFIRQYGSTHTDMIPSIEAALCHHYGVREVKDLGYGPLPKLMTTAQKLGKFTQGTSPVMFEGPLCPKTISFPSSQKTVGLLGSRTADQALMCLLSAPLLADLEKWTHWSLVFQPQHGDLRAFIERNSETVITLGPDLRVFNDLGALEVAPGVLLRTTTRATPETFAEHAGNGDVINTAGHLVSIVMTSSGVSHAPLALLANHMEAALSCLVVDGARGAPGAPTSDDGTAGNKAVEFVLGCLVRVPTVLCQTLANQVFLEPLGRVVGMTTSKSLLLRACGTDEQHSKLHILGLLLGVGEWQQDVRRREVKPVKVKSPDEDFDESSVTSMEEQGETEEEEEEDEKEKKMEKQDEEEEDKEKEEESSSEEESDSEEDEKEKEKNSLQEKPTTNTEEVKMQESGAQVKDGIEGKEEKEEEEGESEESSESESASEEESGASTSQDMPDMDPATKACWKVVEDIRRNEFGVGLKLEKKGEDLVERHKKRIGRGLERLSKELYTKDTHFVLELVQNADDNDYEADVSATLVFVVEREKVTVLNNEAGFQEANIRALCDVGNSTKGKHKFGYIGHKGIGFKSVFRVSDKPEVHSLGYHICFDASSDPMGYILPHWLQDHGFQLAADGIEGTEKVTTTTNWETRIDLPLKPDLQLSRSLANRFHDIQPSLLLFLHKLRNITIIDKMEGRCHCMERLDVKDNVIEIHHSGGLERWLVVKKLLDAKKVSKDGVESTELALAFLLESVREQSYQQPGLPDKQPVFAFLPLRSYGFRFIVQGDFDIPSSREDVDRDSPWNQWLRGEVPGLFAQALQSFKNLEGVSGVDAVCRFLQFVPMPDEILDFFKPVAMQIVQHIKAQACIPVQAEDGQISWKLPSQTILSHDPLVKDVIDSQLLSNHLNLFYIHGDVAAVLERYPALSTVLGIQKLSTNHLIEVGKAMATTFMQQPEAGESLFTVAKVAKWLACVHRAQEQEYNSSDEMVEQLQDICILPLSCGSFASANGPTIFFPLSEGQVKGVTSVLARDLNTVHPGLLSLLDDVGNSHARLMLNTLGVKKISPIDVINHHILPILESEEWKSKSRELLIGYLVFIKSQWDLQPDHVNLDRLKPVAQVVTNKGLMTPSSQPVHFTPAYGNRLDLQKKLPGNEWTLLDSCYLGTSTPAQHTVQTWRHFFVKLGVLDFLAVKKERVKLSTEQLEKSPWSPLSSFWPKSDEGYEVEDFTCAEFYSLVMADLTADVRTPQMQILFEMIDKEWDGSYRKYSTAQVFDPSGVKLCDTESSFLIHIKTIPWVPGIKTSTLPNTAPDGSAQLFYNNVFMRGSELYEKTREHVGLLAHHVPYLTAAVQTETSSFGQVLQLQQSLTTDRLLTIVKGWCSGEKSHGDQDEASGLEFSTSLGHIKCVYHYLQQNCNPTKLQEFFNSHPGIFVPNASVYNTTSVVHGRFYHKSNTCWADTSGMFLKYQALSHGRMDCRKILQPLYDDLAAFFCLSIKVDDSPSISEYVNLLEHLVDTIVLPDNKDVQDVFTVYATLGAKCISASPLGGNIQISDQNVVEANVKLLVGELEKKRVFPTKGKKWVCLEDKPMIADDRQLEEMFRGRDDRVHFLNFSERTGKGKQVPYQKEYRDIFLKACGICSLSQSVQQEYIPTMYIPCPVLQKYVHMVVPYIQRFLLSREEHLELHDQLLEAGVNTNLQAMMFVQVTRLEVVFRLQPFDDIVETKEEICGLKDNRELYIQKDNLTAYSRIHKEVAKLFSRGDARVQRDVTNFLDLLSPVVLGQSPLSIDSFLTNQDIEELSEEVQMWEVPAPVLPVEEEEEEEEEEEDEEEEKDAEEADKPAPKPREGLYSWPPKSSLFRPQAGAPQGAKQDDTEEKWPAPAPPEEHKRGTQLLKDERDTNEQKERSGEGDGQTGREPAPRTERQGSAGPPCHDSVSYSDGSYHVKGEGRVGDLSGRMYERQDGDRVVGGGPPDGRVERAQEEGGRGVTNSSEPVRMGGQMRTEPGPKLQGHFEQVSQEQGGQPEQKPVPSAQMDGAQGDTSDSAAPSVKRNKDYSISSDEEFLSPKRTRLQMGPPVWTTGSSFEDALELLADSSKLDISDQELDMDADDTGAIGRWGETLVYNFLTQQKEEFPGQQINILWVNKYDEQELPYDIKIIIKDDAEVASDDSDTPTEQTTILYVEVKCTVSQGKEYFPISSKQVEFAMQEEDKYHLYRVYGAGDADRVRICRIRNLAERMIKKEVNLLMLL
ncbi:uncharacterized protein LOC144874602 isoform X2 [Branchiostoma floridae x Branchiostoma japonicum]